MSAPTYDKLKAPTTGTRVDLSTGKFPEDPIVCLLRGDGIGQDVDGVPGITTSAVRVLDAAVQKAYGGKRKINWFDVHAGDVARSLYYPEVKDEQVGKLSEDEQRKREGQVPLYHARQRLAARQKGFKVEVVRGAGDERPTEDQGEDEKRSKA